MLAFNQMTDATPKHRSKRTEMISTRWPWIMMRAA